MNKSLLKILQLCVVCGNSKNNSFYLNKLHIPIKYYDDCIHYTVYKGKQKYFFRNVLVYLNLNYSNIKT